MNENTIPKWQRELRSFLGIKSGIILEGNVYDEFPRFSYQGDEVSFLDVDNLDQTILSLVSEEQTAVFFFDPVDGFYCYENSIEEQRRNLLPLFTGYATDEITKNHGCTVCLMPSEKKKSSKRSPETEQYIWVSEIMLQQTQVDTVKNYYTRFLRTLPDIASLAEADEDLVFKLWEGLGYYNRARNLKAAAQTIVEEYGGQLPADYDKLLSLKGIGMYTAGAIGSIAFELQVPAVDGNVLRVLARLWGDDSDILKDKTKKDMGRRIMEFMPEDRPGDFNQALIELGATVCVPNGKPLCDQCPWDTVCRAYKEDLIDKLPVKTPKKARKIEHKTVFLLECNDQIAIHKRGDKGLLAGLWEFPNEDKKMDAEDIKEWMAEHHMEDAKTKAAGKGKHIFSHVEWHMEGVKISLKTPIESKDYVWVLKKELENTYALPSAFEIFRKIL